MSSAVNHKSLPIGIFDSGVGGLTVYRALREHLPGERFVYLGDTARVPYGTKSLATIERYAVENAKFLHRRGIKLLVIACGTASALAIPAIRRAVPIDVMGVVEPSAAAAVAAAQQEANLSDKARIGVIATEATVNSRAYLTAIEAINRNVQVLQTACPLFVPLAEEGWADSDEARSIANKYLQELRESNVQSLILGCTHYPILRAAIQTAIGDDVQLIESGAATAREVERLLREKNSLKTNDEGAENPQLCDDRDYFYVTDAAERFRRVATRFLGSQPSRVEAVEVWGQDELRTT